MRKTLMTSFLVGISLFFSVNTFGQEQKKFPINDVKDPIVNFNEQRTGLIPDTTISLSIKALTSESKLSEIVDLLNKLDNKIIHLQCDLGLYQLKVGYSNSIQLLDLLQILSKKGFPATFITGNGQKASLNAYGDIEYWNIKN